MVLGLALTQLVFAYELSRVEDVTPRWAETPIAWALDLSDLPTELDPADVRAATAAAFDAWALLGTALAFEEVEGSDNAVFFEVDWRSDPKELAREHTAVALPDGVIVRFEIAVNPAGDWDLYDLQSTLTHEIGHALGLEHSDVEGAVMFPSIDAGELRRELHADDEAAVRFLYPLRQTTPGACTTAPTGTSWAGLALILVVARRRCARASAPRASRVA